MGKIVCLLSLTVLACGQNIPGGTINGRAISADVFRSPKVCESLGATIRQEARNEALKNTNIVVTPEEVEATRNFYHRTSDPKATSASMIAQTQMFIEALTAVDKGQDPQQVFTTMLQPKGVNPEVWKSFQEQWKNPEQRANIESRLAMTPEVVAKSQAAIDYRAVARSEKLDRLVDEELAAGDPAFKTALEHWNTPRPNGGHLLPLSEKQYLDAQRQAYWAKQEGRLAVVLNDPKLAQNCGLAATK